MGISKNIIRKLVEHFGIFSAFLLITVISVYFYSPVIITNASETNNTEVGASVSAVASVTLDTNSLEFTFTPTSSGVFDSKSVTATAKTNSQNGYEMYFSSVDNDTDMVNGTAGVSDVIASDFTGTVTSSSMGNNKWGYSLDNTEFSTIPIKDNQLTLKNLDHLPTTDAEKTSTVNIGVKVDNTLASGTYTKDLIFSVVAHEVPVNKNRLVELTSMQDSNLSSYCSVTYTPTASATVTETAKVFNGNLVPEAKLEDTRDGNTYTIRKLADGNCWMTENLRIINKTIDSTDSDMTSGSWNVPTSSTSGFSANNTNNAYLDTTYGGYYTFYTATAGWGTSSVSSGNSTNSICPKGWRLPIGGSSGDFNTLYSYYNSASAMLNSPINITLSGYIRTGSIYFQTSHGYEWSATVHDANNVYYLANSTSSVGPANYTTDTGGKGYGFTVRCVAR